MTASAGTPIGLKTYQEKYLKNTITGSVWQNEPKFVKHVREAARQPGSRQPGERYAVG
jgi:hypothetical protein